MFNHRWADAVPIGIAFVDRSGVIARTNPALNNLLGSRSAAETFPLLEQFIASPAIQDFLESPVDVREDSGGPNARRPEASQTSLHLDPVLVQFLDDEEGIRFAELSGGPVPTESKAPADRSDAALMICVEDVTERELARNELAVTREALENNRLEIEQFAYVISHDLREPLRKVTSFCGLIEEHLGPSLDEVGKKYLDFAVDGSHRMKDMIDALLVYSRIRPAEEHLARISVAECLDKAKVQLAHVLTETEAQIETGSLPEIEFDESRLIQLFIHLIDNAVKFRGESAATIRIEASRDKERPGWLLEVSDSGIGIEVARHDDVFEIFKRLHSRQAYPGTGIGLSLCRRIIDQRGGEIRFVERPGTGTTVLVAIPDLDHDLADVAPAS